MENQAAFLAKDFWDLLTQYRGANPQQRKGQAMWNLAIQLWPKAVEVARGGQCDPFYNDARTGAFYAWLLISPLEEPALPGAKA